MRGSLKIPMSSAWLASRIARRIVWPDRTVIA